MSREWVDGDVAMVNGDVCMRVCGKWDHGQDNRFAYGRDDDRNARPLVVIDAEDREQAQRLADAFTAAHHAPEQQQIASEHAIRSMQAALREFANPTPRIEEPTGIGAVVDDTEGRRWVRLDRQVAPWVDGQSFPQRWRDLDIVRIVSEGVTQ